MAGSGYGDCMIGAWCEGRVSPSREGDAEVRRRPTTAAAEDVDGRTRLPSRWRRDRGSAPGRRGKALSWARGATGTVALALADRRGGMRGRSSRVAGAGAGAGRRGGKRV